MLHDHPELPEATTVEVTGKIVKNCQRMTALIKDLLTLSDIENIPAYRLIKCDLVAITAQCRSNLQDAFPEAKINIRKNDHESYSLLADPSLIELAITNLIENAIKYSVSPAHIEIVFENTPKDLKFSITDQGIGIPPADLEHIFERFYTVNKAHSQKLGGSGLGLSIVQTIVHKHFGEIFVTSELGKGTTFTVVLPRSVEM
jgi:two-component system phosphate regulon sensor histidine kinase PhoR